MNSPSAPSAVVDNMVLVMFVDSGEAALLSALAGGSLFVSPSILDSDEWLSGREARSEFVKGMDRFQRLNDQLSQQRLLKRQQFLQQQSGLWLPTTLSQTELRLGYELSQPDTRRRAKALNSALKMALVDPGEAECAAIALHRGWRLWSDDSGIVPIMRTLYPEVTVERTCALVARAVNEGLLNFADGIQLYEGVFKGQLSLRSAAKLEWRDKTASCVVAS